jgi:amino-acid N-acetyltransferase
MLKKASLKDVKAIHALVNACAGKGEMLPRSLAELYDNLRDYFVFVEAGAVLGTGALHLCWEDLAEVRSVCVEESMRSRGVGRKIVETCLDEARRFEVGRVFVLTYQDAFFSRFGFVPVDKTELPQKIWTDCIKCAKFPMCDEVAMVMTL